MNDDIQATLPASPRHRALTAAEVDAIGMELDAVRREVIAALGEREARYIRQVQAIVRYTEIGGRGLLFAGWLPPAWLAGTSLLAFSKIVDNMELVSCLQNNRPIRKREFLGARWLRAAPDVLDT